MGRVRSTLFARIVSSLLVLSIVPSLFATAGQASALSLQGSMEVWLRAQLRVTADPQIDAALERAAKNRAKNLKDFVAAFISAYEEEAGEPPARIFADRDLSDDALIAYLQRRFVELTSDAVTPRIRSVSSPVASSLGGDEAMAAVTPSVAAGPWRIARTTQRVKAEPVISLRTLTPARSQGP